MLSDSEQSEKNNQTPPKENSQNQHSKSTTQNKKQQLIKLPLSYYYHTTFKRSFVKGILAFSDFRNIQDIILMLRETCASQSISPEILYIWVQSFLVIFKVEQLIEGKQISDSQLLQIISSIMFERLSQRKSIKEDRVRKVCMNVFHEVGEIGKRVNVDEWCRNFLNDQLKRSDNRGERILKREENEQESRKQRSVFGEERQLKIFEDEDNWFFS